MTVEEAAAEIREHAAAGHAVRPRGGGTKLGWGGQTRGDWTSTRGRSTGSSSTTRATSRRSSRPACRWPRRRPTFAAAGQMLALDPPLGAGDAATVGGVIAANDSGPMRHRYGGVRDLVVGITVVLSDGTIAKSGGKVIKNVAGYDLAKLFAGSFGTLGLIARVAVRLHPAPARTATADRPRSDDPDALAARRGAARRAAARGRLPRRRLGRRRRLARRPLRRRHRGRAGASAARERVELGDATIDDGRRRALGAPARPPARADGSS